MIQYGILNNKCQDKIFGQQIYIFDIQRPHREKDSSGTQQDNNFSADMSNIQQLEALGSQKTDVGAKIGRYKN